MHPIQTINSLGTHPNTALLCSLYPESTSHFSPFSQTKIPELLLGDLFWSHICITSKVLAKRIFLRGLRKRMREWLGPMAEGNCARQFLIFVNKLLITLFYFWWTLTPWSLSPSSPTTVGDFTVPMVCVSQPCRRVPSSSFLPPPWAHPGMCQT